MDDIFDMLFHHSGLAAAKRKAEKDALGSAKRPKGKAKAKAEVKVEPVKQEAHCHEWSSKLKTSKMKLWFSVVTLWFENLWHTQGYCRLHMDSNLERHLLLTFVLQAEQVEEWEDEPYGDESSDVLVWEEDNAQE